MAHPQVPASLAGICVGCGAADPAAEDFPAATACPRCAVPMWQRLEAPFAANDYCGAGDPGTVRSVPGGRGVVFTASGAVNYYRGDMRIPAGRHTGSLALTLAHLTGGTGLAAAGQAVQLPVRDTPEATFCRALADAVEGSSLVVELRGMRERPFDVCVGTGPLPDARTDRVAEALVRLGRARGLSVAVNEPFGALPPWTVPHYSQVALGVPAVQVQLASRLRDPGHDPVFAQLTLGLLRAAALAG